MTTINNEEKLTNLTKEETIKFLVKHFSEYGKKDFDRVEEKFDHLYESSFDRGWGEMMFGYDVGGYVEITREIIDETGEEFYNVNPQFASKK